MKSYKKFIILFIIVVLIALPVAADHIPTSPGVIHLDPNVSFCGGVNNLTTFVWDPIYGDITGPVNGPYQGFYCGEPVPPCQSPGPLMPGNKETTECANIDWLFEPLFGHWVQFEGVLVGYPTSLRIDYYVQWEYQTSIQNFPGGDVQIFAQWYLPDQPVEVGPPAPNWSCMNLTQYPLWWSITVTEEAGPAPIICPGNILYVLTEGEIIQVGQIPEPATLVLLGLGGLALLRRRRRHTD